jgi:hypothetical protein
MARDEAYRQAEKIIEEAQRSGATELILSSMQLTELPESIGQLTQFRSQNLANNQLTALPELIGGLTQLQSLIVGGNKLRTLPGWIGNLTHLQEFDAGTNQLSELPNEFSQLTALRNLSLGAGWGLPANSFTTIPKQVFHLRQLTELELYYCPLTDIPAEISRLVNLRTLHLHSCKITTVPSSLAQLTYLKELLLGKNQLTDLPVSLAQLEHLKKLDLDDNPLNPELAAAYRQGLKAIKAYLRAKAAAQITLNEAKLILVGEGEVGKTCLMDALLGKPWQEHDTTHGIEIKQIKVTDPESKREITLNGWDFGGQRVYRPTHQLFFSAPAIYLVVWKPREGPQQGFVKEWVKLVKHREPDAKILVVATHGGPQQRQPDIDRQELWDLFGKDTVLDFFHVESKPDKKGNRRGIKELKMAIARVASKLPMMGRSVPKSWQDVREALQKTKKAY